MKHIIKFIVLALTWPLLLGLLFFFCLIWLFCYSWDIKDRPTEPIKEIAYSIWHFKAKGGD